MLLCVLLKYQTSVTMMCVLLEDYKSRSVVYLQQFNIAIEFVCA